MNIPDKAVEAGEWALTNYVVAADEKEHWGAMNITQEELRCVYLEAAAPWIVAQALRDYADVVSDGRVSFRDSEARGLRDRAKWLEAGA